MLETIKVGNDFVIWLGGVAAGLAALAVLAQWIARRLDFDDQNVLLGRWYGYGFFHSENGSQFYRETIDIKPLWFWPWRLRMMAKPCASERAQAYRGWVRKIGDYIYSNTKEGFRDDICFEIGRLRISEEHLRDKVIVLHLGNSYVGYVHSATAFLWSRTKLDPDASMTIPNATAKEKEEFEKICTRYFEFDPKVIELQLKYVPLATK